MAEHEQKRAATFWGRRSISSIINLRHSVKFVLSHQPGSAQGSSLPEPLNPWGNAVSSTNMKKNPNQFKTNRFICSYVIRNTECITVQLILIVSNMLIHAVKTEEMCANCRRQREVAHRRRVHVSSEILRQDRKHQHGNSDFALHLCLSARINNSNTGGCRGGQTEALITGTTRLFRLCKRSKWIQDLPAAKSFQPEKEQKRSQLRSLKKNLREKQVWSENMRRWNMRRLR